MRNYIKQYFCKHEFVPIVYGYLHRTIENGKNVIPKDYIAGGCVVRKENFGCSKCGKGIFIKKEKQDG